MAPVATTERVAPLWQHIALADRTGPLWWDSDLSREQRVASVLWMSMPGHEDLEDGNDEL